MKTRTERHVTLAPPVATPVQPLTFEEKKARLENISAEWRSWIHHIVFWNAGAGVTGGTVAGLAGGLLETSNHGSNTNLHNVGMNAAQLPLGVLELTTEVGFVLEVSGLTAGGLALAIGHGIRAVRENVLYRDLLAAYQEKTP